MSYFCMLNKYTDDWQYLHLVCIPSNHFFFLLHFLFLICCFVLCSLLLFRVAQNQMNTREEKYLKAMKWLRNVQMITRNMKVKIGIEKAKSIHINHRITCMKPKRRIFSWELKAINFSTSSSSFSFPFDFSPFWLNFQTAFFESLIQRIFFLIWFPSTTIDFQCSLNMFLFLNHPSIIFASMYCIHLSIELYWWTNRFV